jgi:hypothetical protein
VSGSENKIVLEKYSWKKVLRKFKIAFIRIKVLLEAGSTIGT